MRRAIPRGLLRYLLVGVLSFGLDLGLIYLLHDLLLWAIWLATVIAFLSSFFFNYLLQRAFAFASTAPHGKTLIKYVLLVAMNTVLTVLIVEFFSTTHFGWAVGKVAATVLTASWNYLLFKFWLFPEVVHGDRRSKVTP